MNLGNAIKELRKHRGLSQAELAEKCGISTNSVCSIEKNASFPTKGTFDKICKALEMPSAYIFLFTITDEDFADDNKRFIFKNYLEKNLKELVLEEDSVG